MLWAVPPAPPDTVLCPSGFLADILWFFRISIAVLISLSLSAVLPIAAYLMIFRDLAVLMVAFDFVIMVVMSAKLVTGCSKLTSLL